MRKEDPGAIPHKKSPKPQAEESLSYLSMILENVSDAVISFDKDTVITYWNKGAEKIYGWTSEEAIGRISADLLRSDLSESKRKERINSIDKKGELLVEAVHYTKENKRITVESHIIPIKDRKGKSTGYVAVNRDVTERKKAEEELRSVARFPEENPDPVLRITKDGYILYANKASRECLSGFIKGAGMKAPDDWIENISEAIRTGKKIELDYEAGERIYLIMYVPNADENYVNVYGRDITGRKQMENALLESEQRFRTMVNAIPQLAWVANPDGYIYWYNERWYEYTGTTPKEMEGWGWQSVHDPDELPKVLERWIGSINTGEPFEMIFPLRGSDGIFRQFLTRVMPLKNKYGQVIQWFGTNTDVTEQKMAEMGLLESEERLLDAQKLAHVGGFSYDILTGKIEWTEETFNIYEVEQFKGVPSFEVITNLWHPEDRPWVVDAIKDGMINNHLINFECRLLLPGDKVKYINYIGRPVYDNNGRPVKRVGAVADITDRKLIQIKLEEMLKTLQDKERQLLEAQRLAHMGSTVHDIKTGRYNWTEEVYRIFEIDPEKGDPLFEDVIKCIHPDDIGFVMSKIKEIDETRKKATVELRIVLPDSRIKHLNLNVSTVYDDSGKPVKRIGTVMDITEAKNYRLQLENTMSELQRSNKELEQFAYVASHDLQEPIRMISSYTTFLERQIKDKLDEKTLQYMYYITDGAKRMHALIQDLLTYSRVTSKKAPFVDTNMNNIMSDILKDLQVAIADHKVEILTENMPVIKADPTQMNRLFQNLIQNAIKFRTNDKPLIQIKAERKGREWTFSVKDNGIGIDPQFHEKIFEIFQRLHEKEKYPGTGIGLAVCKKIAEHHGGRIWVESELGSGSKFCVTIPI